MYNIKYIILIILIIHVLVLFSNIYCVEGYDAKIPGITATQCGTECTNRMKCAGFGYKPENSVCYISKNAILGKPLEGLFSSEYNTLDRVCNKINKITDNDILDSRSLTENSIYMCTDGENNINTRFQYANYGATSLDDTDMIVSGGSISMPSEVNYYLNKSDIIQDNDFISDFITEPNKIKHKYIVSNNEVIGSDIPGYQCIVNVPQNSCLLQCSNDDRCIGAEWNEYIETEDNEYNNVCCHKSTIDKIIPRREQFKKGKFYTKVSVNDITKDNTIVITNNTKDDISNRFNVYIPEINKLN